MLPSVIPFVASDPEKAEAWLPTLQRVLPGEKIACLADLDSDERTRCTVAIVANPDPAALKTLPNLRWVHSVWAGVERLVADLGQTDLKIVRLVDPQLAATMAEAVLAWTLYLHRDMPAYARQQQRRLWQARDYVRPERKTVTILGLGALGEAAAQGLLQAGFNVCGWSRSLKTLPGVECHSGMESLPPLLAKTDILVCLLPLTAKTKGLLDAETLTCLPQGASLINFARGPVIDAQALRTALDEGHLDHAVLDVFDVEPLPEDRWEWRHPRVTVLPHCSAPTDRESASALVAANIRRYRETGEIPPSVDVTRGY